MEREIKNQREKGNNMKNKVEELAIRQWAAEFLNYRLPEPNEIEEA